jgi:hypothetical protein
MAKWYKMKLRKFETPHGPAEFHYYQRLDTGAVNLSIDFKVVFKRIPG